MIFPSLNVPGHSVPTALLFALTLAGCAASQSSHQAIRDSYHRDAETCRARNPATTTASARSGGNLNIPPFAELDRSGYLACMQGLGYKQDPKTDPLLKALDRCQRQALKNTTAGFDAGVFQQCLRQRGFQGEAGRPAK